MVDNMELIAQSAIRIKNQENKIIYFDPFKLENQYKRDADYIFITHQHFDHFSPEDILKIKNENTKIVAPRDLEIEIEKLDFQKDNVLLVEPSREYNIDEIKFSTIPAYNINKNFHKKEFNWVGYVVEVDNKKIYVAGDTDNTEEARNVMCDIACVPIGGTYTMTYKEAVDLILAIKPKAAIPIHYKTIVGTEEDAQKFKDLLENDVEVKILMK